MIINKFEILDEINHAAAELFLQLARKAIYENRRFTVALTGGSSPVKLYKILAQEPYLKEVNWESVFGGMNDGFH